MENCLKFEDIFFSYPNGPEVLRGLNLQIGKGEKIALMGLNGAGKSTLLLMANGLQMPDKGEVVVCGIKLERKVLNEIRRLVGLVFQNADDQLFMPSLEEDVAFGPLNMNLEHKEVERRVKEALESVGLLELRKRNPSSLSGGQKRMGAIATVLSMRPEIMILDEPTANLDWRARRELIRVLRDYDKSLLVATHDLTLVEAICNRVVVIGEGRIVADGATPEILSDDESRRWIGLEG